MLPKCLKNALKMEATMKKNWRRFWKWTTVFGLRRLQRIEGQAVQETMEKRRKNDSWANSPRTLVFFQKVPRNGLKSDYPFLPGSSPFLDFLPPGPRAAQKVSTKPPRGAQGPPKGRPKAPKGCQWSPKGLKRVPKMEPKSEPELKNKVANTQQ